MIPRADFWDSARSLAEENEQLRTQLRAAVDALRPFAAAYEHGQILMTTATGCVWPRDMANASNLVAAYDAQHGEGNDGR